MLWMTVVVRSGILRLDAAKDKNRWKGIYAVEMNELCKYGLSIYHLSGYAAAASSPSNSESKESYSTSERMTDILVALSSLSS